MNQKGLKKKSFINTHRFAIAFFVFLMSYHVIIVNRLKLWDVHALTYSQYCADFSFGFGTKLLHGAIYRFLFGGETTPLTVRIYSAALVIVFFALLSFKLEKFIKRMPEKYLNSALLLILFFLSGPFTFGIYTKMLGLSDTYWLFIALAFIDCLEHRKLRFLIPFLIALSLFFHFSAIIFVIPLFSIFMLYYASICTDKKEKTALIVVFGASLLLAAVVFFVLILNESRTVVSMPEFHRKLKENGTDFTFYYDYAFFHKWGDNVFVPEEITMMKPSLMKFIYLFYYQVKMIYDELGNGRQDGYFVTALGVLIVSPIVVLFTRFHKIALVRKSNRLRQFCAFLMIAHFPFLFILAMLFAISVDMTRYLSYAMISMFSTVLIILYNEEQMREVFFEKMLSFKNSLPLKLYALIYFVITLQPMI